MSDNWKFRAVKEPEDVTDVLRDKKARVARVAAVGQENVGAQFQVWYVESDHHKDWHLSQISFDKAGSVDTDGVVGVLDQSDTAAVTFFGQDKSYYVWWLD